jgi:DNA polymerase epsilon subunit 1
VQVLFKYMPYFYISVEKGMDREVESVLRRKYADQIADVVIKQMWDLDLPNHLGTNSEKYSPRRLYSSIS